MGCDIHPILLVNYYGWEPRAVPDGNRCYAFFAALAGVRGSNSSHPPIFQPRGKPEIDIYHPDTMAELVDGDHSDSWFTLTEMKAYDASWLKTAYHDSTGPFGQWQNWIELGNLYARQMAISDSDVMFVFNFDN